MYLYVRNVATNEFQIQRIVFLVVSKEEKEHVLLFECGGKTRNDFYNT